MLDVSGPRMAFLAFEIYTLGKQTVRIKNYISCCIFVGPVDKYVLYDGVRTTQLGVAGARPPRAAARARDRKVGNISNTFRKSSS